MKGRHSATHGAAVASHEETRNTGQPEGMGPERREPAIVAVVISALIYYAIPEKLAIGPVWFPIVWVAFLLIPTIITYRRSLARWNARLGFVLNLSVTVFLTTTLVQLISAVVTGRPPLESPQYLWSGCCLWVTNILVFALWYWRLDAGGPNYRDMRRKNREPHSSGCFIFPPMTLSHVEKVAHHMEHWHPDFWDYLFLAFNTSTALSPTDTTVLTRPAKGLMMLQASVSLLIITIIASYAVNNIKISERAQGGSRPEKPTTQARQAPASPAP